MSSRRSRAQATCSACARLRTSNSGRRSRPISGSRRDFAGVGALSVLRPSQRRSLSSRTGRRRRRGTPPATCATIRPACTRCLPSRSGRQVKREAGEWMPTASAMPALPPQRSARSVSHDKPLGHPAWEGAACFEVGWQPASALASPDTGLMRWEPVSRWAAHVRWRRLCPGPVTAPRLSGQDTGVVNAGPHGACGWRISRENFACPTKTTRRPRVPGPFPVFRHGGARAERGGDHRRA